MKTKKKYWEDKREFALYMREQAVRIRAAGLALLGGKCSKCGFEDHRALQIDHIHGRKPGEKKNQGGVLLFKRILAGKRAIEDLQLLCANCHAIKTWDEHPRKY